MERTQELLSAQSIDAQALEDNRKGKLAAPQAARLAAWVSRTRLLIGAAVAVGAAVAALVAMRSPGAASARYAGPIVALVMALITLWVLDRFLIAPVAGGVRGGKVASVEGSISRVYVAKSRPGFAVWVDGKRYGSEQTALGRALRQGERVRLYVLPGTKVIAGAEPLA